MTHNMTIKMMKMWNLQLRVASACSAFDDCLECRSRNPDPCRYTPTQGLTAHALGSLWLHSRHVIDSLLQNMLPTTVHNQKDPPQCSSKGIHCVPFLQSVSSSSGMDPNRFEPACAHVAAIAISCHIQEAHRSPIWPHGKSSSDGLSLGLWHPMTIDPYSIHLLVSQQPRLGVHGRVSGGFESNRRVHSSAAPQSTGTKWCDVMQRYAKYSQNVSPSSELWTTS